MRVLVMGAGALGSVVGGFMAKDGHEVTLVGRQPHMDAIRRDGLRITGIWGEHTIHLLKTCTDPAQLHPGDFDLVLIVVKTYDTRTAVEAVKHLVDDNTLVCSYQNGLGNAECIAEAVGWERCIEARAIFGAWVPQNGAVEVTVIANPTALGTYNPSPPTERVKEIVHAMDEAGVPTVYSETIATVLWAKVAYNCALNPMSALLDLPYGALAEMDHTRPIIEDVIHELYAVGNAMNIPLDPPTPEGYADHFFNVLIPPTAAHYASMREDFRRHRPTEIDALNGAIWRYGEEHGIPCPVNATLTCLVRGRENTYPSPRSEPRT